MDLRAIYLAALERCDPAALVAARIGARPELKDRPAIALGKCAMRMAAGLARGGWRGRGLAIVPTGYESGEPAGGFDVVLGSHPQVDDASFRAGDALLRFADALREPALVLLSGGASAAAEAPLAPHVAPGDIATINEQLVRSGLPIARINVVRKHLSAIKGGRLALRLPDGSESWIVSDVPPGQPELVGSGPTSADASTSLEAAKILATLDGDAARRIGALLRSGAIPETPRRIAHRSDVLADNRTLLTAAGEVAETDRRSRSARRVEIVDAQLDDDVESVASALADVIERLEPAALAIAGGEPTVTVRGRGRGGRCSEVALRLLRAAAHRELPPFTALVGSSDGRDGNSGAAGYVVAWGETDCSLTRDISGALAASDAHTLASRLADVIQIPPTGNNLRDIMMMARR